MTDERNDLIGRRGLLGGALLGAGASALGALAPEAAAAQATGSQADSAHAASDDDAIKVRDDWPIAATKSGKVRGYQKSGIFVFKGMPYGDTTEGEGRFQPPRPPKPWDGVRSSLQFGPVSPQGFRDGWLLDETAFIFNWSDGFQGEDCLRVNVWTPGLDAKKRPVVVWCHGGGFTSGSSQEMIAYDGENLSRRGDVVVVSHTHRLNALGYLNLSKYGAKYKDSGNVGMLDILAALQWVRDNIESFGGDPGNVTIMGQSGGGAKVGTLMTMPAAKGLFHKASIESGSSLRAGSAEASAQLADQVLAKLGIGPGDIEKIHTVPVDQIVAAGEAALAERPRAAAPATPGRPADRAGFGPYVDGEVLPRHPFDPDAPPTAASVPLMVGTVLNEQATSRNKPELEQSTEDEAKALTVKMYGPDRGPKIWDAYRKAFPRLTPFKVYARAGGAQARSNAIKQATLKSAQSAPVYLWWFTWQTAILDGRPGAFHCSDIPFIFYNTDKQDTASGGGQRARDLSAKMSDAWIRFAYTGDPNHSGLPKWSPFKADSQTTMIFDDRCDAKVAPDKEQIATVMA